MAEISFETLSFRQMGKSLLVTLLKWFSTKIPVSELEKIGTFSLVDKNTLSFERVSEEKAYTKFGFLLENYFKDLKTNLTGNPATYIHRNSGIPLIGNVAFGIVYRGSSIIEIKPVTSCNLDCVYCSISEGLSSTKNDFVIEEEYMVEELQKMVDFIGEEVEVHIGVQGEPFVYADMDRLIGHIQQMENVHTISIDTNGTFLTKERIDSLAVNDKLQLNLSFDAMDPEIAKKIAGVKNYNIEHVKEIIAYASKKLKKVIVAPVLTKGYNEDEIEKIVEWFSKLDPCPTVGIQNFLRYKTGRNPGKEIPWDEFYDKLKQLQEKYGVKLLLGKEDFSVRKTKALPKPFMKGDIVTAVIKSIDRFPHSVIAVAKGRNISVPGVKFEKNKKIKVEILRDKHNVFTAKLV